MIEHQGALEDGRALEGRTEGGREGGREGGMDGWRAALLSGDWCKCR